MARLNPLDYPTCFAYPLRIAQSAWLTHVPFGMFVVDLLRPKTIVELGTDYGVSYCAFCQAVKTLGLDTRCYAVDTWKGDPQTRYYGDEVLADLRKHHDPLYGSFSRLIQSTFDEAVQYFEGGTVDLLHVDGYHTYDAVKHDYETWLPKMSRRGVILFHDINVHEREFGVWKLWDEAKSEHPSFEFKHGHGLGVLAVGSDCPPALGVLLDEAGESAAIGDFFYQLGIRIETAESIQSILQEANSFRSQLDICQQQSQALSAELTAIKSRRVWRAAMFVRGWTNRLTGKSES